MRLPVISGTDFVIALRRFGYEVARQKGSHARLVANRRTPITVPLHKELKPSAAIHHRWEAIPVLDDLDGAPGDITLCGLEGRQRLSVGCSRFLSRSGPRNDRAADCA